VKEARVGSDIILTVPLLGGISTVQVQFLLRRNDAIIGKRNTGRTTNSSVKVGCSGLATTIDFHSNCNCYNQVQPIRVTVYAWVGNPEGYVDAIVFEIASRERIHGIDTSESVQMPSQ
jgi:hypothetical protein